jgi:hypothetical protein
MYILLGYLRKDFLFQTATFSVHIVGVIISNILLKLNNEQILGGLFSNFYFLQNLLQYYLS